METPPLPARRPECVANIAERLAPAPTSATRTLASSTGVRDAARMNATASARAAGGTHTSTYRS
eukprot:360715-Chlamydomonas_euryale.AAC.4